MFKLSKLPIKYLQPNQRGVILLLTILVLVGILAVALGVASLMIGEIKITRETPLALKAYYAAEVGVERKLYEMRRLDPPDYNDIGDQANLSKCSPGTTGVACLEDSDTCYSVNVIPYDGDVCKKSYCIKSYGCHKRIKRSIEVSY